MPTCYCGIDKRRGRKLPDFFTSPTEVRKRYSNLDKEGNLDIEPCEKTTVQKNIKKWIERKIIRRKWL
jgi:hypothetical protein